MVCTLTLDDIKPHIKSDMKRKPKITLMLFQNRETKVFPREWGENFSSYHKTLFLPYTSQKCFKVVHRKTSHKGLSPGVLGF